MTPPTRAKNDHRSTDRRGATRAGGSPSLPRLGTPPAWRTTSATSCVWSSPSTTRRALRRRGRRARTSRRFSTRRTRPRSPGGNPPESARTTRVPPTRVPPTRVPTWRPTTPPRRRRLRATAPAASTRTPSPRRLTLASSTSGGCTAWTTTPARNSPWRTTSRLPPRVASTRTRGASCAPPNPRTRRSGRTSRARRARMETPTTRTTPAIKPTARSPTARSPPTPRVRRHLFDGGGPRRRLGRFTPTAGASIA
mmetsp:Transcript_8130/g.32882  ORF Transcript_8130/g.32882 Transcript_8130/m.32882 type:complete len:253 (+) Transcript_8130:754-1512(+)